MAHALTALQTGQGQLLVDLGHQPFQTFFRVTFGAGNQHVLGVGGAQQPPAIIIGGPENVAPASFTPLNTALPGLPNSCRISRTVGTSFSCINKKAFGPASKL